MQVLAAKKSQSDNTKGYANTHRRWIEGRALGMIDTRDRHFLDFKALFSGFYYYLNANTHSAFGA